VSSAANDALAPPVEALFGAWAERVAADKAQVERCREVADPADFYAPVVNRFRADPRRTDDDVLAVLLELARAGETWLDVGAGGGRYALPLALRVREVIAVEPSPAMVKTLQDGAAETHVNNVRIMQARWPMEDPPAADVGLIAHIGYDIGNIGPFLGALEASSRRLCVAVMGEAAMTTVATLFWQEIHGEPRVRLPAMPELLAVLLVRGRLPAVQWMERVPSLFDSVDDAVAMARRQLWLRDGSEKDERLRTLAGERLIEVEGRFTFDDRVSKIGVATWSPR
jgi:SAM-dependent methyltransferase